MIYQVPRTLGLRRMFLLHHLCFFNDTATTEIYTLSLHDALPICRFAVFHRNGAENKASEIVAPAQKFCVSFGVFRRAADRKSTRLNSQSRQYLVCRLLLEKKK